MNAVLVALGNVGFAPRSVRNSRHGELGEAEQPISPEVLEILICSEIARASSTSMPKYRTVPSNFVWLRGS
jgi:hypothetical protein